MATAAIRYCRDSVVTDPAVTRTRDDQRQPSPLENGRAGIRYER